MVARIWKRGRALILHVLRANKNKAICWMDGSCKFILSTSHLQRQPGGTAIEYLN